MGRTIRVLTGIRLLLGIVGIVIWLRVRVLATLLRILVRGVVAAGVLSRLSTEVACQLVFPRKTRVSIMGHTSIQSGLADCSSHKYRTGYPPDHAENRQLGEDHNYLLDEAVQSQRERPHIEAVVEGNPVDRNLAVRSPDSAVDSHAADRTADDLVERSLEQLEREKSSSGDTDCKDLTSRP